MFIYVHIHVCIHEHKYYVGGGERAEMSNEDDVISSVFPTGLIHAMHTVGTQTSVSGPMYEGTLSSLSEASRAWTQSTPLLSGTLASSPQEGVVIAQREA